MATGSTHLCVSDDTLVYAWDGQASTMRTYTFKDVNDLLKDTSQNNYTWEVAKANKIIGKNLGYYIMGYTKTDSK